MYLAIKSEMDSRPFLYPLMKALNSYGSVCVISSNPYLKRLIDDDLAGGFRNIRILVDESGASDDIFYDEGIQEGDFDFIILDNMAVAKYDIFTLLVGSGNSEEYDDEILMVLDEENPNTWVVHFGKRDTEATKKIKERTKREKKTEEEYDPASKFKEDEDEAKRERQREKILKGVFPTYAEIEALEGERYFPKVDTTMCQTLYTILKDVVHVDSMKFRKEVSAADASSGYIKRGIGREI